MDLIVAVDENWAIGWQNQLLFRISADLRRFKAMTLGQVVVMGRKTLESLPGGRPLPGRVNVVLSRRADWQPEGVIVCRNMAELAGILQGFAGKKAYVIGGEAIYRQLLPACQRAYVTRVSQRAGQADAFLTDLEQAAQWQAVERSERQEEAGLAFQYVCYKNLAVQPLGEGEA